MKQKSSKPMVVVTGSAGFIGNRLTEKLLEKNIDVICVDKSSYFKERTEHAPLAVSKIVDRENFFQWLEETKPSIDAIFHMGACTDTTELNEDYLKKVNLEYSQKIWQYCSKNQIPLVYASSAATYGEGEHGYSDEESSISKLKPLNPYGQSKQDFDVWALEQEKKKLTPPAWSGFKFFNVYGFGERHKKKMASVILHAFDQINQKGFVKLFKSHKTGIADGHQKRDFIFVDDLVDVLLFAYEKPIKRGIFNLGTGTARTFLDLVKATFKSMNKPEKIEFIDTPEELRARYQYFTQAEMQKLRSEGYQKTFTTLENGVNFYIRKLL